MASSDAAGSPGQVQPPHIQAAQDVQLHRDTITWTHSPEKTFCQATTDELLFIVDLTESSSSSASASAGKYLLCCLRENAESPSHPFELVIVETASLPETLRTSHHVICRPSLHLLVSEQNQVDVIVSTRSGTGQAVSFWQHVLRPLAAAVVAGSSDWKVTTTQDAQSVQRYAQQTLGNSSSSTSTSTPNNRTIILISGDGGVVDLLNGGSGKNVVPVPLVALLPLGTGNALFHSLHKLHPGPSALVTALRTLFTGVGAKLPLFKATFSPGSQTVGPNPQPLSHLHGAIVASYAFHASIVHESDTPEYRVHGSQRFNMVAQDLLRLSHPYKAQIDVKLSSSETWERNDDDNNPDATHAYVLVSMVSNLEKTFTISPRSTPLDGKLHLVHLGPVDGDKILEAMTKAYDGGKHVGLQWPETGQRVRYDDVKEVRIITHEEDARWRKFCVDGLIVDVPKGGGMTVARLDDDTVVRVLVDERVVRPHC